MREFIFDGFNFFKLYEMTLLTESEGEERDEGI